MHPKDFQNFLRPFDDYWQGPPQLSISSGQRNLMKTYHNDANTSGITKIALKNFLDFFDKEDRLGKLQKSGFQSHFST